MGKATRWLKGLFCMKKEEEQSNRSGPLFIDKKEKARRNKSGPLFLDKKEKKQFGAQGFNKKQNDYNKKAVILRSLSHGSSRGSLFFDSREWLAALIIQSFFRGYLARKAHRALRALVKIQALVRGFLVRKRVAATFHSIQALMRAQAGVRSQRARRSFDKENVQDLHRTSSRSSISEYRGDMHHHYYETTSSSLPSNLSRQISVHECHHSHDFDWSFIAHGTPRLSNSSHANIPLAKSVSEETSLFLPNSNSPNYMANTHSSKARVVRSRSAPKQRSEVKKRAPLEEIIMATRNSMSSVRMHW